MLFGEMITYWESRRLKGASSTHFLRVQKKKNRRWRARISVNMLIHSRNVLPKLSVGRRSRIELVHPYQPSHSE